MTTARNDTVKRTRVRKREARRVLRRIMSCVQWVEAQDLYPDYREKVDKPLPIRSFRKVLDGMVDVDTQQNNGSRQYRRRK